MVLKSVLILMILVRVVLRKGMYARAIRRLILRLRLLLHLIRIIRMLLPLRV
jgi:hypothetical protein